MSDSADIDWLRRRWSLPEAAAEAVVALRQEEAEGGTASRVEREIPDWGSAAASPQADVVSPLVLVRGADGLHLQSRRLFRAESEIAARLQAMARSGLGAQESEERMAELFPGASANDRQVQAAHIGCTRALTIITGGPGTGKTYTLARILALICESGIPAPEIRLAAPTGKAADRMKTAVRQSLDGLPTAFQKSRQDLERIAEASATIHALVGYNPGTGRCRYDARHPLPCSLLIVDECSMIDALLWKALLDALPPEARLILLGDPNQLESVGQGNVFAELARVAAERRSVLHPCHVHLTEARRFRERPGILALARALERSDADAVEELLRSAGTAESSVGVRWVKNFGTVPSVEEFPIAVLEALERVAVAPSPQAALEALDSVCILTAQREYFVGAKAMSAAIETHLAGRADVRNHPVIINRNDPETGLRNGTVGVIHMDAAGHRLAYFRESGGLKSWAVARLPEFSPAWAITIHRSQGSEYDDVLVILPHEASPLATRELLYTAITRARRTVFVAGEMAGIRKAALKTSRRRTLLAWHFESI